MSDALDAYVGRGGFDYGRVGGHQGEEGLREDEHHGGQNRVHAEGDQHTRPHAVGESGLILLDLTHEEEQGEDDGLAEAGEGQVAGVLLPVGIFQRQQDVPAVLEAGLGEAEHRLTVAVLVVAGECVG